MGVPKKRKSKSRVGHHRSQWERRQKLLQLVPCPNCGRLILPHHICPYCHHYKGKEVKV